MNCGIEYKIIDNLLKKSDYIRMYDLLCNPNSVSKKIDFSYTNVLQKQIVAPEVQPYNYMFAKTVFSSDENYFQHEVKNIFNPLFERLNCLTLFRVKVNLYPKADKIVVHGLHQDLTHFPDNVLRKIKTAVYCVNTNNGKIVFSDGTEIDSIENRVVIFNSNTLHSGTTCTDQHVRCIVNLNYLDMNL